VQLVKTNCVFSLLLFHTVDKDRESSANTDLPILSGNDAIGGCGLISNKHSGREYNFLIL
jgi:hemin uptake protein HemP